jgi:sigma-E factor negative regulatory protein RseA
MSDQLKESVSALMDGEADELELRRLLASENSSPVDSQWARYHLVRDVLQNSEQAAFRHLDISKQVAMAVSEQPIAAAPANTSQWWRPVAGFAVAASVAMAVVVGVQSTQQFSNGLESGVPAVQGVASSRVYPVQGASLQAGEGSGGMITYRGTELPGGLAASKAEANLAAQERLDKYILRHTERAALNNSQGMISFARVASFETE